MTSALLSEKFFTPATALKVLAELWLESYCAIRHFVLTLITATFKSPQVCPLAFLHVNGPKQGVLEKPVF